MDLFPEADSDPQKRIQLTREEAAACVDSSLIEPHKLTIRVPGGRKVVLVSTMNPVYAQAREQLADWMEGKPLEVAGTTCFSAPPEGEHDARRSGAFIVANIFSYLLVRAVVFMNGWEWSELRMLGVTVAMAVVLTAALEGASRASSR